MGHREPLKSTFAQLSDGEIDQYSHEMQPAPRPRTNMQLHVPIVFWSPLPLFQIEISRIQCLLFFFPLNRILRPFGSQVASLRGFINVKGIVIAPPLLSTKGNQW